MVATRSARVPRLRLQVMDRCFSSPAQRTIPRPSDESTPPFIRACVLPDGRRGRSHALVAVGASNNRSLVLRRCGRRMCLERRQARRAKTCGGRSSTSEGEGLSSPYRVRHEISGRLAHMVAVANDTIVTDSTVWVHPACRSSPNCWRAAHRSSRAPGKAAENSTTVAAAVVAGSSSAADNSRVHNSREVHTGSIARELNVRGSPATQTVTSATGDACVPPGFPRRLSRLDDCPQPFVVACDPERLRLFIRDVWVRSSLRLRRAAADSSGSHAGHSGSAPSRHVRPRAFAYEPRAMTAKRLQADPNAPQTPHHTSREGMASSFGEAALSCSAAYSPDCPTPSWSRRSSGDRARPTRRGILGARLTCLRVRRKCIAKAGRKRTDRTLRRVTAMNDMPTLLSWRTGNAGR